MDPRGELACDLLARLLNSRAEDLIVVDLADRAFPVPLNLIAWSTIEGRDFLIGDLLASLLRIYPDPHMFGPVFETNFRTNFRAI